MINIIAAVSKNGVIGKDGKLPWKLDRDMARFKSLTISHTVIMGANTYREIGKPLADRFNIIISSKLNIQYDNAIVLPSLTSALDYARKIKKDSEIFICGGERIYKEAIEFADRLYITHIDEVIDGDAYFPSIPDFYSPVKEINVLDGNINTRFCEYVRKSLQ
ncbi:MAG: dihydrofolate reductase [Clostridia bacterium]|nr:dihydrofolate reductase [Clostridia bacterium]